MSLLSKNNGGRSWSAGGRGAVGEIGVMDGVGVGRNWENVDWRGMVPMTTGTTTLRSKLITLGSTRNFRNNFIF